MKGKSKSILFDKEYSGNFSIAPYEPEFIEIKQVDYYDKDILVWDHVKGNTDHHIPFFQSAKEYGLLWDNNAPTVFTDNAESTSFKSEVGDCIDYYLCMVAMPME